MIIHYEETGDETAAALADEASTLDTIDAETTFARDMALARAALRRDRVRQRRAFARSPRRVTRRARRTRTAARVVAGKTATSGHAPPPGAGDPRGDVARLPGAA
jgi:hypothetical protein